MSDLLPFVITGLATGSIYGLAGAGLVLTYKTSGIFNFGHGAIATAAAYLFYWLWEDHGVDWKLALILSVFVAGPVMGLLMEPIARSLSRQRTSWKIVGTVGIVLIVQGLATVKYGAGLTNFPRFLPGSDDTFRFLDVNVGYDQVIVFATGTLSVIALFAMFRWTRTGLAMRGVVDDPDLVAMQATNPRHVRRTAWIIGTTLAALSGVLIAPFIGLEAILLTFLVVQAFGAAAIGAFSSIPLTFVGGLAIGIAADISKKYVLDVDWLSGLPASLPFIVLVVVLLVLPRRKLLPPGQLHMRPTLQWRSPPVVRITAGLVILVPLLLVPEFAGTKLGFFTMALTQMILILSLGLLVRTSGQVSLCQATFAAVGAVVFSQLVIQHDLPWLVATAIAGLIVVPIGAIVAIPAIRLSGLFLALATFGFGIMVERLLFERGFLFSPLSEGRLMPRPSFASSDQRYYYVVLAFVVATALFMTLVHRSRLGRILRGLSDSQTAVSTMGLDTNTTKVIVFCISAFIAAVAGILYGASVNFAISSDSYYTSFSSLILLAVLALAPFGAPWYALFAGIGPIVTGYADSADATHWLNVAFGFFAVVIALRGGHPTMPVQLRAALDRLGRKRPAIAFTDVVEPLPPVLPEVRQGLEVQGLTVKFGGLVAVDRVSFSAPTGRITGLIGPNGAGKTSTFDACSGLNRRISGRVRLHDDDVTRLSPSARARRGLGRTFQHMQLCESLPVVENVALGMESGLAGGNVASQLVGTRKDRRAVEEATSRALDLCGITDLADRQAGDLSTGQRRLVELARCLAGPFDVLLLDEPSSGLSQEETFRLGDALTRVVDQHGYGILLVEHDVALVLRSCSYIYVLDFGEVIFEGDPEAFASSSVVQAAYLGADFVPRPVEEARS